MFRAVNIALVNELKTIYEAMGIDIWQVIAGASTKPFGYMPFYPGPGLGGHCVPVDPFYLAWKAGEHDVRSRFIELAGEINDDMPRRVVARLAREIEGVHGRMLAESRILLLGVSYKRNIDDVRESPGLNVPLDREGGEPHRAILNCSVDGTGAQADTNRVVSQQRGLRHQDGARDREDVAPRRLRTTIKLGQQTV